jgi:hypothetical protein
MNGPKAMSALSPFDSQLRTLVGATRRSHSCLNRTHAPQQTSGRASAGLLRQYLRTKGTLVPEWDRQFRLVRVHHEHREELGRLRLAGIGVDAVAVAGQLGEALPGLVGRHRSVVDLTADRPLKDGRVDEGGFGMRVARRVTARDKR